MSKSPDAFRTIREVADWLGVAAHVLRFWESKFSQIRPVKRAGGRRYYRPADMELVGGIKVLLHDRGMTVRGVQRMLREEGVAAVSALSPPIDVIAVPPELLEGIAEEAAWREDARAETARPPTEEVDADTDADTDGVADAQAATGIEAETASDAVPDDTESTQPEPEPEAEPELEAPVEEIVDATASPEEPVLPMAVEEPEPEAEVAPDPEPEPEPEPEPAPDIAARTAPGETAPADFAAEAPQTPGNGLDRLAAFVTVARTTPDDDRPRLRPAINALRRLKERMERPVDGTHG